MLWIHPAFYSPTSFRNKKDGALPLRDMSLKDDESLKRASSVPT